MTTTEDVAQHTATALTWVQPQSIARSSAEQAGTHEGIGISVKVSGKITKAELANLRIRFMLTQ